jgi:hypothetical protein
VACVGLERRRDRIRPGEPVPSAASHVKGSGPNRFLTTGTLQSYAQARYC